MSSKSRIFVVDDEPGIVRFLRVALIANDFEFESARSVQEATKYIAGQEPDVIVLDLGLPDGDGKDVIRRVREWSDVPIIVISARDREAEKIEALDLGADDFVTKPFGVGELMARDPRGASKPGRTTIRSGCGADRGCRDRSCPPSR
jgi:two-component system, OmpR family, KDP operon response regulator KdpE